MEDAPHPLDGPRWWHEIGLALSGPGQWAVMSLPPLGPLPPELDAACGEGAVEDPPVYEQCRRAALARVSDRAGEAIVASDPGASGLLLARLVPAPGAVELELAPARIAGARFVSGVGLAGGRVHVGTRAAPDALPSDATDLALSDAVLTDALAEVRLPGSAHHPTLPSVQLTWSLAELGDDVGGELVMVLRPLLDEDRLADLGAPRLELTVTGLV